MSESLLKVMRYIIPISGKDSLATALIQTTIDPDKPYEFIFNDTRCELPPVYEWLDKIEFKTGWKITRLNGDLEAIIDSYGGFLPNHQARYCTRQSKIQVTEDYLNKEEATVYYGLRADENRIGYVPSGKANITPDYPLQTYNIDLRGVWSILEAQQLLPPSFFWQRLYDAVEHQLGHLFDLRELKPYQKHFLFNGRSRANCYFCFFQRQYEFLWLYEEYPEYFEKAKSFEKSNYSWKQGYPLTKYDDPQERERIFKNRVNDVCKMIITLFTGSLFQVEDTEIANTSCGLLCGK